MLHGFSNRFLTFVFVTTATVFSLSSQAGLTSKNQTAEELATALQINQNYFQKITPLAKAKSGQPVLETDAFRYLLMRGDDTGDRELFEMHRTFAENLPENMILVLVTETRLASSVREKFLKWLPQDRFVIASSSNLGDYTWGRDSYPYPVYQDDQKNVELIAKKYHRAFSGHKIISEAVGSKNTVSHDFVYVGGNLQAAENGDCFIVDSRRAFGLPDSQFLNVFRCKTINRFPHIAGIGDIDEVIKVLPNKVILSNQERYREKLENLGYRVVTLPEIEDSYRTYANSVILNDTVFMPTFGGPLDTEAQKVYEKMGYKVIGIRTNNLSDYRNGSLHCLTMTYPDMDLQSLLNALELTPVSIK